MSLRPYLDAALLGVIQGIAEFLPISSSGHLVVFGEWLKRLPGGAGADHSNLALNVALHIGTFFSIVVVYRRDLSTLWQRPRLIAFIVLATIPAAVVGLAFKKHFEAAFALPIVVACGWIVTAAMLWCGQRFSRNLRTLDEINAQDAIVVGLFQALALVPGISRSGSTIAGGLASGMKRDAAAAFSFLIALPAIGGAGLVESRPLWMPYVLPSASSQPAAPLDWSHAGPMLLGAVVSFVVGIVVLRWLLRIIVQYGLNWFACYCLAAAGLTLAIELAK
jgi:undecaprenyl-diphosphatase